MKHIKLASALVLVLGTAAVGFANAASSNGGTITFTGQVTDTTCTVTGGAGTNGGTGNFTVALASVSATALNAAGVTAGAKPFSVVIGGPGQGTCQDGKVATLTFDIASPQVDAKTGNLANALSGQATNTEIQLLDSTGNAINLASPTYSVSSPAISNNTAQINLQAQYYATGAATPGEVSTSVVYNIAYN
jgi:major type 1 subunit fimbrin (pilin)